MNEEEHNTFKFNNGIGAILVKVIPLPLIIAGIYYQIDPSFLALEISGKSASIFLSFILLGQMMWQLVLAQRAKGLKWDDKKKRWVKESVEPKEHPLKETYERIGGK